MCWNDKLTIKVYLMGINDEAVSFCLCYFCYWSLPDLKLSRRWYLFSALILNYGSHLSFRIDIIDIQSFLWHILFEIDLFSLAICFLIVGICFGTPERIYEQSVSPSTFPRNTASSVVIMWCVFNQQDLSIQLSP